MKLFVHDIQYTEIMHLHINYEYKMERIIGILKGKWRNKKEFSHAS